MHCLLAGYYLLSVMTFQLKSNFAMYFLRRSESFGVFLDCLEMAYSFLPACAREVDALQVLMTLASWGWSKGSICSICSVVR